MSKTSEKIAHTKKNLCNSSVVRFFFHRRSQSAIVLVFLCSRKENVNNFYLKETPEGEKYAWEMPKKNFKEENVFV